MDFSLSADSDENVAKAVYEESMLPLIIFAVASVVFIISIISLWKIFKKAGRNGWEAIIPIYNLIILAEIAERPIYYAIFSLIPPISILVYVPLVKRFGKDGSFGVLMALLPFVCLPILAFGGSTFKPSTVAPVQNVTEVVSAGPTQTV